MLPETRESLLIRLADADDARAWDEFVAIYRPMILRLGLRKGLQVCDAEDMTQRVLMSVSRAISEWEKDPARGGFRTWLRSVTRNAILNTLQRGPRTPALGGSDFLEVCHEVTSPAPQIDQWIDDEFDRCVLRLAASRVQTKVSATTWKAFEMTAIQNHSPQAGADALGVSVGKIYGAKGRVVKLLQEEVEKIREAEL